MVVSPRGLPDELVVRLLAAPRNAIEPHGAMIRQRLLSAQMTPIDLDGPAALQAKRDRTAQFRGAVGAMRLE